MLLGGAAGGFVSPDDLDIRLTFEDARAGGYTLGSGVVMAFNEDVDLVDIVLRIARFFRDESCGQCVPVPRGHRAPGGGAAPAGERAHARLARRRARAAGRHRAGRCATPRSAASARRRPAPCSRRSRSLRRCSKGARRRRERRPARAAAPADRRRGRRRRPSACPRAPRSWTPAAPQGVDTPTLCYADNLTPVNACRVCVVEVEGARTLVPACSRAAEDGMKVKTDTERVQHSRKLVMEFLASQRGDGARRRRRAPLDGRVRRRSRRGSARRWSRSRRGSATPRGPATTTSPTDPTVAEGVHQPVKIDNELYVRDYSRCILCYKCVEACGVDAQNTFAIAVAGRGFDARISTEYAVGAGRVAPASTAATASACAPPAR